MNILFLGDLCMAGEPEARLLQSSEIDIWRGVGSVIEAEDLIVANLESSLSKRGQPKPLKYACLRAEPTLISKLDRLNIAAVGNNHISDYGEDAAKDTLDVLNAAGVSHLGYGKNLNEALRSLILDCQGLRLGLLAYSCLTTNGDNYATPYASGVAPLSLSLIRQSSAKLRPEVDALFVYLHWGVEQQHYPTADQMRVARRIIDWGADAVIGGHAHVVQSYESYRDGHIFYGLGNFLFGDVAWSSVGADGSRCHGIQHQRPENRESIAPYFEVKAGPETASVKLLDVKAFSFDSSFVPQPMPLSALSIDWNRLNRLTRTYAWLHHRRLLGSADIPIRAVFGESKIDYYYASKPINQNRMWRVWQFLRGLSPTRMRKG